MLNQVDIDKIKEWTINAIISNVASDSVRIAEKAERELLAPQTSSSSFSHFYSVQNLERARIRLRMNRGSIMGVQTMAIPSSTRTSKTGKTYKVKAHNREYKNKHLFRLSGGQIVVEEYVPSSLARKLLTDGFYEALVDRAQFFQGSSQKV